MRNIYTLSILLALGFLILSLAAFNIWQLNIDNAYAQDEEYYQEYDDGTQIPEYEEPIEDEGYDQYEDQNPDPEFMEEVEPGEYDQSDDTTELNEDGY